MNTENSMTNEPHRFRLTLADKLNLKDLNKIITLANLSIYYTWKTLQQIILLIVLKIKTGYKLQLISLKTMKLLGSTKQNVDQDKDG